MLFCFKPQPQGACKGGHFRRLQWNSANHFPEVTTFKVAVFVYAPTSEAPAVEMSKLAEWAEAILSPSPLGLVVGILLVLTLPIFIHFFIHRPAGLTLLPSILLVGPSESGKTSLLTLVGFVKMSSGT